MEKKNHTFFNALKLWLIWNVLVDLSLGVFLLSNLLSIVYASTIMGNELDVLVFSILIVGLVLGSLLMGLIQWIAFKNRIKHAYRWILATSLGSFLAGGVLIYLSLFFLQKFYDIPEPYDIVVAFLASAIGGAVIGLLQWLVLRRKVMGAVWWLLGSIVGWVCAGLSIFVFSQTGIGGIGVVLGLLPMGMITGVAYVYLFTKSSQKRFSVLAVSGVTLGIVILVGTINNQIFSQEKYIMRGYKGSVNTVAFSPDGKLLATGSSDSTVTIWNLSDGREIYSLSESSSDYDTSVESLAFSLDGKLLASVFGDGTVKLWDLASGKEVSSRRSNCGEWWWSKSLDFTKDGNLLVSGGDCIWRLDPASGMELSFLLPHAMTILDTDISADGKLLVTGDDEGFIQVWDVDNYKMLKRILIPSGSIENVAFSNDGKTVIVTGKFETKGSFILCDWAEQKIQMIGNEVNHPVSPAEYPNVGDLALSPDETLLAVDDFLKDTNVILFWDAATGEEVGRLRGHSDRIKDLVFSPDGKYLASTSNDGTARVWEVPGR